MKKDFALTATAAASDLLLAGCAASGTPSVAAPTTVTASATITVTDVSRTTRTLTPTRTFTATAVTETPVSERPFTPAGAGAGTTAASYSPPAGYEVYGLSGSTSSYRFLSGDKFDCNETDDSCWGLSVHTQNGCSRGGSATLTVYVKDGDTPVGEVTGSWVISAPDEAVALIIGQVGLRPTPETDLEADLTSITCSS